jgi:hypothetical protein
VLAFSADSFDVHEDAARKSVIGVQGSLQH